VFLNSLHLIRNASRTSAPVSAAWPVVNGIIYVPFFLHRGAMVYRYFWLNGATASTNNVQVGVYRRDFTQIHEGTSTLAAGANVCQFDNITDYYLDAGPYYMAAWCSGTTETMFATNASSVNTLGIYYETNAGGLPATGTPADPAVSVSAYLPVFGLALRATDP